MRQKNTIGSTNKVKNSLKQEIYHFYFHFTHILEISRFEVPISRFFWAFLQGLQICTFGGWQVCIKTILWHNMKTEFTFLVDKELFVGSHK